MSQPRWVRGFILLLTLPALVVGGLAVTGVVVDVPGSAVDADAVNLSGPVIETDDDRDRGLNETQIALAAHAEINDARRANGVAPLTHSERMAATAENHTHWMATTEQLNHSDRGTYACEYAGENIAYTFADVDIQVNRTTVVNLNNNETRIAERVVTGWLRSPPHRENLLDPEFNAEGIGVATTEGDGATRVYATQGLCR